LLRPLAERGQLEAESLAGHLAADPPTRVISAPALRCQQTVEPAAVAAGIPVEVEERLAEGELIARVLELLPTAAEGPLLCCTHADVIASLLRVLELAEPDKNGRIPCKKGSDWVLEGGGYTPTRASYFEPVGRPKRGRGVRYSAREEFERTATRRAAVLDMGSTSFTLLIADVDADGTIRPVVGEKVMLRLGAVIANEDGIPTDVGERAVSVAAQLHAVAQQEKAQVFLAVATSAVRDAHNGRPLAAAVSEALGEPVRVLSGVEEARLIFRAFQSRLDLGEGPVLGLDLGGGSLELALGTAGSIDAEATLPLGAVRLHGEFVKSDPMDRCAVEAIRQRVRRELAPHRDALRPGGELRAVATGGTVRALGRLLNERRASRKPSREGAVRLSLDALRELSQRLVKSSHDERVAMRGVRRRRADLLPAGAIILETLAEELGIDAFTVCDWGLRQGVLLDALQRHGLNADP
jgi:phosphohistidine phosphatase SixA